MGIIQNHTFYHQFRTGNNIKVEIVRDGESLPRFKCSTPISELNSFEQMEYQMLIELITDTILYEYTDTEYQLMVDEGTKKFKQSRLD
jgi:hypothetical protein